jgi:hypothetical protein
MLRQCPAQRAARCEGLDAPVTNAVSAEPSQFPDIICNEMASGFD